MKKALNIYDYYGIWMFDEYEKEIVAEPFVDGSSEIITELMIKAGLNEKHLTLTFSDKSFPGYQDILIHTDSKESGTWNLYAA